MQCKGPGARTTKTDKVRSIHGTTSLLHQSAPVPMHNLGEGRREPHLQGQQEIMEQLGRLILKVRLVIPY